MHVSPFTVFIRGLLPFIGAALFLTPLAAQAAPDLSVTKSCVAGSAQAMQCTVTVTNIGDVASVAPLSLTDTITGTAAANLTGVGGTLPTSCTPGAQQINDIALTCPSINTSLAPAASGTVLIDYTMPQGGTFTNCVSVTQAQNAMTPGDPNAANNTNICTTFDVTAPAPTTGSITIVKDAQPNDAQDFTFTSNQASIAPFPLDDDSDGTLSNQKVFTGLPAGTYTFTETQVSGWTLASIACTPSSGSSTNTTTGVASITLAAGDAVTCTFTNTKPTTGSITIVKDAQPNDAQDFTFTSNQASIAPFPLDDDSDGTLSNQKVFTGLPAGTYTFTETQVSGWTLASIVCTPSSGSSTDTTTGVASITLTAGVDVICTFTNTKPTTGTLTIVKDSQPNDPQDFHFTTIGSGLSPFDLNDDGTNANPLSNSITFSNLAAGVAFTVTETAVAGWTVPSIQCLVAVPGLTTTFTDQLNRTFTVTLEAGANVTCTFINEKTAPVVTTGSITIVKDAQPNDAQDFTFTSNQATIAPFPLDDDSDGTLSNQSVFTGLPAGTYTFTETQVSGWTLATIVCTPASGSSTNTTTGVASITLAAGDDVTCTFTNTQSTAGTGTLTIVKDSQPNDPQDFHFTTIGSGLSPFDLNDDGTNANPLSNSITFSNLGAGIAFTVTEDAVSGWTVPSIQCLVAVPGLTTTFTDQLNRTFTVNLEAGANVTCTFINEKTAPLVTTGSITIVKDAQPNDAQDFTFTSNQASIAPFPLDDDSDGTLSNQKVFTGLPAGTYTFTETQVSGWSLTSIACTPSGGSSTNASTGVATLTLAAGDNVTCTFTNVLRAPLTGKICGVKFNDINGNGVQDAGDLGLANWQISVGIAAIPPVMTGTKGEYCFSDLPAGQYTLAETPQAPWQQTFPGAPGTHTETLAAGQQLNGINFGNTIPGGPCSDLSGSSFSLLVNGNFENSQVVSANSYNFFDQSLVPSWHTTESDGLIEVWGNNYGGVPAYSGNQFIELNAKTGATLYQTFTATAGSTVTISFAHRGRAGFANQLSLSVGPLGGLPVTLGTYTATSGGWTLNTASYTFPLNGGTAYQIGFTSGDSSAGGNFLDAIKVIDQACGQGTPDAGTPITDVSVFDFIEGKYPLVFTGRGTVGQTPKYNYRFYKASGNYLAIDGAGMIFMLGPVTDNLITEFGSVEGLRQGIAEWKAGPLPDARVFAYAEANLPAIFKGTGTPGQLQQYNYRYYAETGNYLAVDNAGMIYILGPYSGNVLKGAGSVESFRAAITRWYDALPK